MSIRLEPIAIAHAAAVQALASDPRIADTSNVPHPYPPDGATTWIRYTTAQREQGREANYAMIAAVPIETDASPMAHPARSASVPPLSGPGGLSTDALVGVCGVLNIEGVRKRGELGYWVGVPYWGRGYASAAARDLVRLVFERLGLKELYSSCLVRNPASFRVLEKAGFRHTGYGTHPNSKWGPEDRFAMFELTRTEWMNRNASR